MKVDYRQGWKVEQILPILTKNQQDILFKIINATNRFVDKINRKQDNTDAIQYSILLVLTPWWIFDKLQDKTEWRKFVKNSRHLNRRQQAQISWWWQL